MDVDPCKHRTLYFASGGYYILCSSCEKHWIAMTNAGGYDHTAGGHGLDGKDLRVEAESAAPARERTGTG